MIKAECVAASKCQTKIATFKVTMPRYILAEFNTHRAFTRNSASSRAIPLNKMVNSVRSNTFLPIAWQKDHKGMQGSEYLTREEITNSRLMDRYIHARDEAIQIAQELNREGVTKQVCNRLLEPFMWHTVLVTATEWDNFFELRCPKYELEGVPTITGAMVLSNKTFTMTSKSRKSLLKAVNEIDNPIYDTFKNTVNNYTELDWLKINKGQADIHMMAVAEAIYDAWNEADFKELAPGEWHIPYGDQIDETLLAQELLKLADEKGAFIYAGTDLNSLVRQAKIEIAVARCARLSYQTLGDEPKTDYISDIKLYNNLKQSGHWSPFEHVACAMSPDQWRVCIKTIINKRGHFQSEEGWLANFRGWIQQRAIFENAT